MHKLERRKIFGTKVSIKFYFRNRKKLKKLHHTRILFPEIGRVLDKIHIENKHVQENERAENSIDTSDIKELGSFVSAIMTFSNKLYIINPSTLMTFYSFLFIPIGFVQYLASAIHKEGDGWETYIVNALELYSLTSLLILTVWSFVSGSPGEHPFYSAINIGRTELCALMSLYSANTGIGFENVKTVNVYKPFYHTNLLDLE